MERKIKRGDIYYANLNPIISSEQGGMRPVLIKETNTVQRSLSLLLQAVYTQKPKFQHTYR